MSVALLLISCSSLEPAKAKKKKERCKLRVNVCDPDADHPERYGCLLKNYTSEQYLTSLACACFLQAA
jgi:hypothetical protein